MANSSDDDINAINQLSTRVSWKDVRYSNEITPKSKQVFCTTLPLNSTSISGTCNSCSRTNQYQLASNSQSFLKTQYSTPKSLPQANKNNSNQAGTSTEYEFSITNPFENQSTIDSLLQPSLSPSIFDSVSKNAVSTSVNQSPGSFWNIDQIALMKPADIDLSKFHEQQNFVKFDPAMELKAQEAIDSFFANGVNIRSPWSSSDRPHYLAIISPAVPPSSRKKQLRKQDPATTPSMLQKNVKLVEKEEMHETQKVNASTQTILSLPFELDLSNILGKYFCNDGGVKTMDVPTGEVLSNSSLRRKLFFHDAEDDQVFDDELVDEQQAKHGLEFIEKTVGDIDVFPMQESSFSTKKKAPLSSSDVKTPLLKAKQSVPKTPSSCQSPFSSSPVTGGRMFDLGTPYRTQDQVKFECFSPGPEYSPIRSIKSDSKTSSDTGADKRSTDALSNSIFTSIVGNSGDYNVAKTTKSFVTSSFDI